MKQISYLLLLSATLLFSCKKDFKEAKTAKSTEQIKQDLLTINAKYAGRHSEAKITFRKLLKIICADIGGAATGVSAGATFGPGGAVAGGIICGAAASFDAAPTMVANSPDEAPSPEDLKLHLSQLQLTLLPNESGNPYDYAGQRHNEIVKGMLDQYGFFTPLPENTYELFSGIALNDDEQTFLNTDEAQPEGFVPYTGRYFAQIENNTLEGEIAYMNHMTTSESLLNIMDSYLKGLDGIETEEAFQQLTLDYENYVMALDLDETDKEAALSGLSTARYSYNLWNQLL